MLFDYCKNKTFLVTGAGSGIGFETVRTLLDNGANVAGMIRKPAENLENLKRIYPDSLFIVRGDVTMAADCGKFVSTSLKKFGTIHGLIHSAGVGIRSSARDIHFEVFHNVMDTNFSSAYYLYQAVHGALEKTKGHFVAVSSIQSKLIMPFRSVYAAAKHALNAYIESVRLEEKEIHFTIINFGYVNTGFSLNALHGNGEKYKKESERQKNGMSPAKAAEIIIHAMIQRKHEITPAGFKEKLALGMYRWLPFFYRRLIMKYVKSG